MSISVGLSAIVQLAFPDADWEFLRKVAPEGHKLTRLALHGMGIIFGLNITWAVLAVLMLGAFACWTIARWRADSLSKPGLDAAYVTTAVTAVRRSTVTPG